jgi:hypothetical protein
MKTKLFTILIILFWTLPLLAQENVYATGYGGGTGSGTDYATMEYYPPNDPPDSFSLLLPPNKAFTLRKVRFDWEDAKDPNPSDSVRYDLYVSTSGEFPPGQTSIDSNLTASEYVKTLDYGVYCWGVKAKDNWGAERWSKQTRLVIVRGLSVIPIGDLNSDGSINTSDVVFLINYLYISGPSPDLLELGDVNCDDKVNTADVVFLINYLFNNGPSPSC